MSARPVRMLALLGFVSWLMYLVIALSAQSLHEEGSGSHSLLPLLTLFGLAFGCYLAAIRVARRAPRDRRLLATIIVFGVAFRGALLLSDPIEEIDLYRYLWDGAVTRQGVSPFRHSPQQVLASSSADDLPDDLARLVALRDSSPELMAILQRVHFGELPTIYPPVSQAVFALAASITPANSSLWTRMTVMKAWFVGFDLATLLLVVRLLRLTDRPVGWAVAYAWCPLLIKEIANSGHLDSLAVFLTTLSLWLAVRVLFQPGTAASNRWAATASSLVLALAVGAKLYPLILAPLVFWSFIRRFGGRAMIGPTVVFVAVTACLAWPMWPAQQTVATTTETLDPAQVMIPSPEVAPVPPPEVSAQPRDPSQSLRAFLSRWEMNDFLFLLVMENLRPTAHLPKGEVAWFSVVPESWRTAPVEQLASWVPVPHERMPFLVTRGLTSLMFLIVALWFGGRAARSADAADWLQYSFLTVAWFWLLLPTQNPWYWTWALPLLPFARGRAWLVLSGLALTYYLRFWFAFHFRDSTVPGTRYPGPFFFDYVVTWLEFAPWFGWLLIEALRRGKRLQDPSFVAREAPGRGAADQSGPH